MIGIGFLWYLVQWPLLFYISLGLAAGLPWMILVFCHGIALNVVTRFCLRTAYCASMLLIVVWSSVAPETWAASATVASSRIWSIVTEKSLQDFRTAFSCACVTILGQLLQH